MIYPDTPLEEWCARYKLQIREEECLNCHKMFKTTVPIAMQGMAGLSTPVHECGEGFCACVLTPMSAKSKAFWAGVVGTL